MEAILTNPETEEPKHKEGKSVEKQNKKDEKKAGKKMAKAVNVIQFHEKKSVPELFNDTPSRYLWIYHFGNGDEDDQKGLNEFFAAFGPCKVYIFPGISYGYVAFENVEDAQKLVTKSSEVTQNPTDAKKIDTTKNAKEDVEEKTQKVSTGEDVKEHKESRGPKKEKSLQGNTHSIKFVTGERSVITFFTNILINQVLQNQESTFPNASLSVDIKGLHVFDDFLTAEEEEEMIKAIDSQEWKELSHRRVQHYGYEFVYGANNIDKNNKIGNLPDFTNVALESKF